MLRFLLKAAIRAAENSYNTPERKGARGERRVHNALASALDANDYRLLSDLILPAPGGTTQLDHLVLSRFGIFVIETKNMSGWIFGDAEQKKWTQIQRGGKRRSFQNPLRQNYAHIKALQAVLGVEEQVLHNFVVFTGTAEPKTEMPENVAWGLRPLGRLIGARRQLVFSEAQVKDYVRILQRQALENTKTVRDIHLQNIEKKAEANSAAEHRRRHDPGGSMSCPKCGEKMVERTNRKTGDKFWGCSRFPKCRGTLKSA